MNGKTCRCGFELPADWPPVVLEDAEDRRFFGVIWNVYLCAPCARAERIETP